MGHILHSKGGSYLPWQTPLSDQDGQSLVPDLKALFLSPFHLN